jgi:hypothetical protein
MTVINGKAVYCKKCTTCGHVWTTDKCPGKLGETKGEYGNISWIKGYCRKAFIEIAVGGPDKEVTSTWTAGSTSSFSGEGNGNVNAEVEGIGIGSGLSAGI